MKVLFSLATAALFLNASAKEPIAKAEWIPAETDITEGESIRTIIRMTVSEGWHTYWVNPGEGGMKLSLKAELPEGWQLGTLQYPVPKRFTTGALVGFGYEGVIDFPLTLTPPAGASGELPPLEATLAWLTCNDESCVPGKAVLALPATTDAEAVATAYEKLPLPLEGAQLSADFNGAEASLSLILPGDSDLDPALWEIFPITPNVLDPASKPRFTQQDSSSPWIASAPKSEYLSGTPEKLEILLISPEGKSWTVSTQ